ncbi:MAG: F0F1 ATP synthase subunit delta [Thiotrichales bacterium]
MSDLNTVARPYARALFETARDSGKLESWSESLEVLSAFAADPSLHRMLQQPSLSREEAAGLLIKSCGVQIDESAKNLVRVLADNGRLAVLPQISALYENLRAEAEGVVEAEIITAMEIDPTQHQAIANALQQRLGREVKTSTRIDPSLIGGAIVRAGDLVIDGSIKGRLDKLTSVMNR